MTTRPGDDLPDITSGEMMELFRKDAVEGYGSVGFFV